MAALSKSKHLFGFTSPRTLEKIIPELGILDKLFSGKKWKDNQITFFDALYDSEYYEGTTYPDDPALAARDRITRAPKALGFIQLDPKIELTKAGKQLVSGKRLPELFTKQLLKFQLPSPYHTQSSTLKFRVKPYLELLRLINEIGSISKTEIALFFLQLTDYELFDDIKNRILNFRSARKKNKDISWKTYVAQEYEKQINIIFKDEIENKSFKTRESSDISYQKFLKTKERNMRDYADAFYRYIRATQLVTINKKNLHLKISEINKENVDFLLITVDREPVKLSLVEYQKYLFNPDTLIVLEDDITRIRNKISNLDKSINLNNFDLEQAKDLLEVLEINKRNTSIENTINHLKLRSEIEDILEVFEKIKKREVPDAPLFLEWNVWRAFAALNHTQAIQGNFVVDLDGMPLTTAPGKKPDIEINYGSFSCIVEVTMSSGETQFNMEGSSVPRHYGDLATTANHDVYCIFIAPRVSEGTMAHFFNLNRFNTKRYGGKTKIIPMSLDYFISFLQVGISCDFNHVSQLQIWMNSLLKMNTTLNLDEDQWYKIIGESIPNWVVERYTIPTNNLNIIDKI